MTDSSNLPESPFVDSLGVQLISAEDGASEVLLPLVETHMNTWGIAHGGVIMTLSDVALAMAARSLAGDSYVLSFALPNFFFHVTTAYDILRHNGVPVGKRDYLWPAG